MNTSAKNSTTNVFSNIAKNAQQTTSTLAEQVNSLATNLAKSANAAINAGVNAVNSAATTTANAIENIAAPVVNSMLPLNNRNSANTNSSTSTSTRTNSNKNNVAMNNSFSNIVNSANVAINNALNTGKKSFFSSWMIVAVVFVILASIVTGLLVFYKEEVSRAFSTIGSWFKKEEKPAAPAPTQPPAGEQPPGMPTEMPAEVGAGTSLLEKGAAVLGKILPSKKEVFNINANDFTYYDAEPMCRALGAELATYDQVKEAWGKGANWCNYGWTKGQLAIYPTQKEFYEKLQSGPPEDQNACGTPGVNGGFFDNPEMRFGVNCYGAKPAQTQNDVRLLEEKGILPQSPETLKMNQQAQEYKERLGSIGVLPFSEQKWSEY